MMPIELQKRLTDLRRICQELSGSSPEFVQFEERKLKNGDSVALFKHSVRIPKAGLRFSIWEQFTDLDTDPHLYAFKYHIAKDEDVLISNPIFRYECHPDVADDTVPKNGAIEAEKSFASPYATEPHFHPDNTTEEKISKLHYPFHRNERKTIVFALINWLRVDLVKRFYSVHSTDLTAT